MTGLERALMNIQAFFSRRKHAGVIYCLALLYVVFIGFDILHVDGIVGATRKNGNPPGCICHNFQASDSVKIWIEGPESVQIGSSNMFTVLMKGGPAVKGGYNVAVDKGSLSPADTSSRLFAGELTHRYAKVFQNDTVRWFFTYQAPLTKGVDTLYSVGNSVNGDGNPDMGDEWNLGNDFIVALTDSMVGVVEIEAPFVFQLQQNYPNPFNPGTIISYHLEHESDVDLSVYNTQGQKLVVLENGRKEAGLHSVPFDAESFASGIYFYKLEAGKFAQIKKMLLLK